MMVGFRLPTFLRRVFAMETSGVIRPRSQLEGAEVPGTRPLGWQRGRDGPLLCSDPLGSPLTRVYSGMTGCLYTSFPNYHARKKQNLNLRV